MYAARALGRLQDLLAAVRAGDDRLGASIARQLMADRAAAIAAGADVSGLNDLITSKLGPLLAGAGLDTVLAMEGIFGPLLPHIDVGPDGGSVVLGTGNRGTKQEPPGDEPPNEQPPGDEPPNEEPPDEPPNEEPPDEPPDEEPPADDGFPGGGNHFGWRNKPPEGGWHHGWTEHPGKKP